MKWKRAAWPHRAIFVSAAISRSSTHPLCSGFLFSAGPPSTPNPFFLLPLSICFSSHGRNYVFLWSHPPPSQTSLLSWISHIPATRPSEPMVSLKGWQSSCVSELMTMLHFLSALFTLTQSDSLQASHKSFLHAVFFFNRAILSCTPLPPSRTLLGVAVLLCLWGQYVGIVTSTELTFHLFLGVLHRVPLCI